MLNWRQGISLLVRLDGGVVRGGHQSYRIADDSGLGVVDCMAIRRCRRCFDFNRWSQIGGPLVAGFSTKVTGDDVIDRRSVDAGGVGGVWQPGSTGWGSVIRITIQKQQNSSTMTITISDCCSIHIWFELLAKYLIIKFFRHIRTVPESYNVIQFII